MKNNSLKLLSAREIGKRVVNRFELRHFTTLYDTLRLRIPRKAFIVRGVGACRKSF